ncbi:MAG: DUF1835 domain-containing protein [Epsilonproteobacteria bacterium]|nr:DUF1835 domain-containing protein [Campylobacterota bacterium]
MNKILNIVNGDAVSNRLKESGIADTFIPWGDFLHDGPVPEALSLEELSKVRAKFISQKGLGEFSDIYKEFQKRDKMLKTFKEYNKIFLWFENDLYDQLQLIQILDWFAKFASEKNNIYIIYPDNYLIKSNPKELYNFSLYNRELVTHSHFITAKKAWATFCADTPYSLHKLLNDDTESLPFLKDAVKRILEEYPNSINGLSKTAHQALLSISNNIHNPNDIFINYQKNEHRPFMGEIIFFLLLKELVEANLLNSTKEGKYLELTTLGKEILKGEKNLFNHTKVDRWIGGVHITNKNSWCWDIKSKNIIKYKVN